ncbi:hypothetical protein FM076_05850 [Streptomyces albus subsp. chlorinus]|uniref:hypothetical protein n=1 Tax=Streptomyces albus TaxID=1888 RepID=UPI00156F9A7C|nr:hypothetical protein [Streptomyces albus]NSC20749.1 hypothetical protein [Streptomyces albus subsp. chlorinus]
MEDAHDSSGAGCRDWEDVQRAGGRTDADKAVDLARKLSQQAAEGAEKNVEVHRARNNQLTELARLWREQHGEWAGDREGYLTLEGVQDQFGKAADHGRTEARNLSGKQGRGRLHPR